MSIDELLEQGIIYSTIGDQEKELECYNKALKIEPNNIGIYHVKISCLSELYRFDEAKECHDKIKMLELNT